MKPLKITRLLLYATVLLFGLLLVQRASSLNASTDDLVNLAGQFVPVLMLTPCCGLFTFWLGPGFGLDSC